MLEGTAEHAAAIREDHGIEVLPALVDDRADQHRRTRLGRRIDQLIGAFMDPPDELRLEHQVLGRIADQLKLRAEQQVGAAAALRRTSSIALALPSRSPTRWFIWASAIFKRSVMAGDLASILTSATFTGPRLAR